MNKGKTFSITHERYFLKTTIIFKRRNVEGETREKIERKKVKKKKEEEEAAEKTSSEFNEVYRELEDSKSHRDLNICSSHRCYFGSRRKRSKCTDLRVILSSTLSYLNVSQ